MTDHPMNCTADMVQALLAGRKTQHRVPVTRLRIRGRSTKVTEFGPSTTNGYDWHFRDSRACWNDLRDAEMRAALPHAIGDRLWVREAFMPAPDEAAPEIARPTRWNIAYASGGQEFRTAPSGYNPMLYNYERWSPPMHMPREFSRLTLIGTDVRVQRVQEISEVDAIAEGAPECDIPIDHLCAGALGNFRRLWNAIYNKRPEHQWKANPWVCALKFAVVEANIDEVTK